MKSIGLFIKSTFIVMLLLTTSACSANNKTLDSLAGAFEIKRDLILDVADANWDYYDKEKTRVLIENVTPITCSNTQDNKFSSYDHCYVTNDPLPKEITFRYGTWISRQDEDRLYPEPPPFRPMGDNEDPPYGRIVVTPKY